ncbi:MAG TPA: dihydroorotase [Waddliaceae bacterium]
MITIKNAKTLKGTTETITLASYSEHTIDAKGHLTVLPALIDGHVHFRTPGAEHKENWITGAQAAMAGGVTTVIDMPNNHPPCVDAASLKAKKQLIDEQLASVGIPLHYRLFLGADKDHINEIGRLRNQIAGVKIYMGSSTGGLIMNDEQDLDRIFRLCAQENVLIAVHAEDEGILKKNEALYSGQMDPATHSKIRDRFSAIQATTQALQLAEKYSTELFILHVSTKEEVELIRKAKKKGILVYAEATPHHLFLNEQDYAKWGNKVVINPPIRTREDQEALWKGIHDRTIDTIGSDHAPHTLEEKARSYGQAPSGVPGIETLLPLLLNASSEGKLTLEHIVKLTRINPEQIFNLEHNTDVVLVDLEKKKEVNDTNLKTKCGWSPFASLTLKGWPEYTILRGKIFQIE